MGDDRKVTSESRTDLVERSKSLFLQELMADFSRRQQQYDLGREFAKTRKNRNPTVLLAILAVVVVFAVGMVVVTRYIEEATNNIAVSIDAFADVNLRDLLDAAKRLEGELERAEAAMAILVAERDTAVATAGFAAEREAGLLEAQELTNAERTRRRTAIDARLAADIEAIDAEFAPKIADAQALIDDILARMAEYDTRQLDAAREQQEVLNNQQRLFDMEQQALRDGYEERIRVLTESYEQRIGDLEEYQRTFERTIRTSHADELARLRARHAAAIAAQFALFNPVFGEADVAALVPPPAEPVVTAADPALVTARSALPEWRIAPFTEWFAGERVTSAARYRAMQTQLADARRLLQRVLTVPFVNSVPDAVTAAADRMLAVVREYEAIADGLSAVIARRDATIAERDQTIRERNATIADRQLYIDSFLFGLEELSVFESETAYVIDPRDPEQIILFVNQNRQIADGSLGYVFRRDDEFIGTIRLHRRGDRVTASVVEQVGPLPIAAYDRVLVQVQ